MDLEDVIIAVYRLVDDALKEAVDARRIRARGPAPILADGAVITVEAVGAFLGFDQDAAIFGHVRRRHADRFPALATVHRPTVARQAANRWRWTERVWQALLAQIPHDPRINPVDRVPVPVCRFARAHRCRRFRGDAAVGHDEVARGTYFGFRGIRCPGLAPIAGIPPPRSRTSGSAGPISAAPRRRRRRG